MSDDYIDLVKQNEEVQKELCEIVQEYKGSNLATQSALGLHYAMDNHIFSKTIEIMGDTIYNVKTENIALRDEMNEKIGEVDEEKIRKRTQKRKGMDTRKDKNKLIREELQKTLLQTKAIL